MLENEKVDSDSKSEKNEFINLSPKLLKSEYISDFIQLSEKFPIMLSVKHHGFSKNFKQSPRKLFENEFLIPNSLTYKDIENINLIVKVIKSKEGKIAERVNIGRLDLEMILSEHDINKIPLFRKFSHSTYLVIGGSTNKDAGTITYSNMHLVPISISDLTVIKNEVINPMRNLLKNYLEQPESGYIADNIHTFFPKPALTTICHVAPHGRNKEDRIKKGKFKGLMNVALFFNKSFLNKGIKINSVLKLSI